MPEASVDRKAVREEVVRRELAKRSREKTYDPLEERRYLMRAITFAVCYGAVLFCVASNL